LVFNRMPPTTMTGCGRPGLPGVLLRRFIQLPPPELLAAVASFPLRRLSDHPVLSGNGIADLSIWQLWPLY